MILWATEHYNRRVLSPRPAADSNGGSAFSGAAAEHRRRWAGAGAPDRSGAGGGEGLIDIGDQVVGVLQTDGQAYQVFRDASGVQLVR